MSRTFLEVTDLPVDVHGRLYRLRPELVKAFNSARGNKVNLELLKDTLKLVHSQCTQAIKQLEQIKEVVQEPTKETPPTE